MEKERIETIFRKRWYLIAALLLFIGCITANHILYPEAASPPAKPTATVTPYEQSTRVEVDGHPIDESAAFRAPMGDGTAYGESSEPFH